MGRRIPVIDKQALVKRVKRILKPREGKERSAPVKMGIGVCRLYLQCMIECIDGIGEFSQFLMGSCLCNRRHGNYGDSQQSCGRNQRWHRGNGQGDTGQGLFASCIGVFRFQLEGLVKGKNRIAVPFQVGIGFSLVVKRKGIFRVMDKGLVERLKRFLVFPSFSNAIPRLKCASALPVSFARFLSKASIASGYFPVFRSANPR